MSLSYHLEELQIALRADDERRLLPAAFKDSRRALDVGCGGGQTLIALGLNDAFCCGIDVDINAVRLGKHLNDRNHFVCGFGEQLPFADRQFDLVICRVALPYMHIPKAVAEMYRVLIPGGQIWLVLHSWGMTKDRLKFSLNRRNWKDLIYCSYLIANGLALHCFGRQLRFPFNTSRCESFQTNHGIYRVLSISGFRNICIHRDRFFVVTAGKPA